MLSIIQYNKAAAFLHRISWQESILLTNKQTCNELREGLDLSRTEHEKIVEALVDSGYVEITQHGRMVVLTVTEQGKSFVAGSDPFKVREKGAAK